MLLDACVWGGAATTLRALGHDVVAIADRTPDPGDDAILAEANAADQILITLDKDFGELAVLRCQPHRGIVRLVGVRGRDQAMLADHVVRRYERELSGGALLTVSEGRVRVRMPTGSEGQSA